MPETPLGSDQEGPFWRSAEFRRRTSVASLAYWLSAVFLFVANVIAARALGPGGYGRVVLAVTTVSLVVTFLDLTLEEGLIHYGTAAVARRDHATARALFRTGLRLDLSLGTAVFVLLLAGASLLSDALTGGVLDPDLLRLAALGTFIATADGTTAAVLAVSRRWDLRTIALAGSNLVRIGLFWTASRSGGPVAVLVAMAVAAALGSIVQAATAWVVAWRTWADATPSRGSRITRDLLRFGTHSSLATTVVAGSSLVVPLVLAHLAGASAVGVFDVALLPVVAAGVLTSPLRTAVLTEHARMWQRGDVEMMRRSVRLYAVGVLTAGAGGVGVGWIVMPHLLPLLYGSEFDAAVQPARVLLIASAAQLFTGFTKTIPLAIGRPGIRTLVSLIELAALLVLVLVLVVGDGGVLGAATAVSATGVLSAFCWWVIVRRLLAVKSLGGDGQEHAAA